MRMMVMIILLLAAAGLFFYGTGNAVAAAHEESCEARFQHYDINGDGMVTLDEYKTTYDKGQYTGAVPNPSGQNPAFIEFEALDKGNKGHLTQRDFCEGRK